MFNTCVSYVDTLLVGCVGLSTNNQVISNSGSVGMDKLNVIHIPSHKYSKINPQLIWTNPPQSEHCFYPVSTSPITTRTRQRKDLIK